MPDYDIPGESAMGSYREGWMQRGRELNELYDIIALAVVQHGIDPTGDPAKDLRELLTLIPQ